MVHSTVAIPNTPSSLLPATTQRNSQPQERDDGGPFKVEMVQRMESLAKGERILPPCDRCRRLHMDCLKNLTACMGCTKKHAKCGWKEVREGELHVNYNHPATTNSNNHSETSDHESGDRASTASPVTRHTTAPSPSTPNLKSNARALPPSHTPPNTCITSIYVTLGYRRPATPLRESACAKRTRTRNQRLRRCLQIEARGVHRVTFRWAYLD
jgi:hypothetical protein